MPGVPSAWRQQSPRSQGNRREPGSPSKSVHGPEDALNSEHLSEKFASVRRVDFADKIGDGFRDAGGRGLDEPCPPGRPLAVAAMVVVDRRIDDALVEFLDRAQKKLARANDVVTRVMVASLLVSEAMGRSGSHAASVMQRCERLILEKADALTGAVRLGDILHDPNAPGNSKARQPGAGTARHRALLFKAVSDLVDLLHVAPCTLCRDEVGTTWNTVLLDGEPFTVDVMVDPGALYEEGSAKAAEYLRRLQEASEGGDARRGAAAPSVQQNLGGHMLRPPWHVEPWEVEFDRRDRAGRGGFGEVFQGSWAGQPIAVKEVRDASPTDGDICDFILEISMLSRLSHPNVIRFWRGCVDLRGGHRTLLLLTEWADRGVLSSFLHESQEPNLEAGQMLALALGMARGVAYLHHVKILHLDLKSPNVLLNSSWQTKLCDFGLAKMREQTAVHTTLRGVSPIWAPPEMFDDAAGGLTERADVYSFGIILFELANRKLPYADVGQMQLPRVKARGQLPRIPDDMDPDFADLVRLSLSHKPSARPAMQGTIARIQQIAKARSLDLQEVQTQMEHHGLHFGGLSGSMPNSEQLRRAEAEKRRAEGELERLRKVLREEERKVLEAEQRRRERGGPGEADRQRRAEAFCQEHTQAIDDSKYRCTVCRKLFRGPEFVHKHIQEKHIEEMMAASLGDPSSTGAGTPAAPPATPPGAGNGDVAAGAADDQFFDADIAEESNAQVYTKRMAGAKVLSVGGETGFNQALQDAAEAGDLSKLQQCLLQGGSSLNQADLDGTTPLHLSAKAGHTECLQYLVSNSADVHAANETGMLAVHLAAQEGHAQACELMLAAGAPPDANGSAKARTPLHLSAANGHKDASRILLLHGATVNLQDDDGESPLHNAARFGDRELCEAILSWGASVSAVDSDGWSPLHEAARWGDGELVECFLQRGADMNARSNDGESPLHVVPGGYAEFEVVEVLLAWKCDVNSKDYDGETPLHVAVKLGDPDLAGVLLNNGADANSTSNAGATPLDFAKKDEIRWLLRSHKARRGAGAT